MQASSVIDIYTSVLGWHINNRIWELLEHTGLFLIPFMIVIFRNLLKAREQKDKADIGVLAFRLSETHIYVMFFTILLLVKPTINLNYQTVNYTERLCTTGASNEFSFDDEKKTWGQTGSTFDVTSKYIEASFDGQSPRIPILWYPLEWFLRAVTESAKHSLPCQPDLRTVSGEISASRIKDPILRDETEQFYRDCWRPSANRFLRDKPEYDASVYPDIREDISWLGSEFFSQHPHYYHRDRPREGLRSFPYVELRDNMIVSETYSEGRGWPFCAEWWTSPDNGLKKRLLEDFNKARLGDPLRNQLYRLALGAGITVGAEDLETIMLKEMLRADLKFQEAALTNNYTRDQAGGIVNSVTAGLSKVVAGVGVIKSNVGHSVEMHVYQLAAPVIQALILLLITLALPILFVVSLYRLEVVFALLMLKFSVIFWGFLFQLAFWLDNFLLEGLLDHSTSSGFWTSLAPLLAGEYDPTVNIIDYITRALYIVLPVVFSSLMSIAGYRTGAGIQDATTKQGQSAASSAGSTANMVQNKIVPGGK